MVLSSPPRSQTVMSDFETATGNKMAAKEKSVKPLATEKKVVVNRLT